MMKSRYGKHAAAAAGLLLMGTSIVQAATYINAAGGKWEVPANWDTGTVPSGGDAITIAGSAGGQPVVMDTNSWNYIIASNLNHSATQYRTSTVLLGGTGTASLDVDIGEGNTWLATASGTYYIGSASGSDATLNVLSGDCAWESSLLHVAQFAGSTGRINVIGTNAYFAAARASGEISLSVGTEGDGTVYIDAGTLETRMGVRVAGSGTFEVAGSGVTSIGIGSRSSLNGNWQQDSNGVLKVGIDSGGITPILIDDKDNDGPDGFVTATFEEGSLLEPYFIDGLQTGKWTVMTVDGSVADSGLALDNGGDTNWSFNVVSNYILEVWYGLGDSGYTPPEPPAIVYTNVTCIWDGEFGDTDWDNPTNWAFASNMVLPLQGAANASIQVNTNVNYPVYTLEFGSRTYNKIYVGAFGAGDGRMDVTGSGFGLAFGSSGTHYVGGGGSSGVLNLEGGHTLSTGSSTFYVGRDATSTGIVNVVNNARFIPGRESGGLSLRIGADNGHGEMKFVGGRFRSRAGISLAENSGTALFTVEGSGGYIEVGRENTLDGSWVQNAGATLQCLVTSNGLTTIELWDKDGGSGANAQFEVGSSLDVDFSGWDGNNGSWDVMRWGVDAAGSLNGTGSLLNSNLAFAAGVDTNTWSFDFVDTDATNGVDTLRITASGFVTVQPNITEGSVSNDMVTLTWDSEPVVGYNVLSTTDLLLPWTTNIPGIVGTGPSTTTNLPAVGTEEFYKIEAYGL